jgi:hypothetical protein
MFPAVLRALISISGRRTGGNQPAKDVMSSIVEDTWHNTLKSEWQRLLDLCHLSTSVA